MVCGVCSLLMMQQECSNISQNNSAMKQVRDFFTKAKKNFDVAKKFAGTFTPGSRILLSQTNKNDAD